MTAPASSSATTLVTPVTRSAGGVRDVDPADGVNLHWTPMTVGAIRAYIAEHGSTP